jgi:hypothetical protein
MRAVIFLLFFSNFTLASSLSVNELDVLEQIQQENVFSEVQYKHIKQKLEVQKQINAQKPRVLQRGPGGTASVSGTLTDTSMLGIEGTSIELYNADTGGWTGSATSDINGDYTISGLSPGNYYVWVRDDYDNYLNYVWRSNADGGPLVCMNCNIPPEAHFAVADGEAVVNIDFEMVLGGSVSGTLTDTSAMAVEGTRVTLYNALTDRSILVSFSDVSGSYSFQGLEAGSYYVSVDDLVDNYLNYVWRSNGDGGPLLCSNCVVPAEADLAVALGVATANIDFELTLGGTINGVLTDALSMTGVGTLLPTLIDEGNTNSYYMFAEVDPSTGVYSISGIPDGNYRMHLDPSLENLHIPQIWGGPECNNCPTLVYDGTGSLINIASANTVNNIDFSLNVGASISGFLVDNNTLQPLPDIGLVMVFNELNYNLAYIILYGTNYIPEADGSYTVGGLLPGSYYVQGGDLGRDFYQRELFENNPCYWSGCDRGSGDAVVLSAGENRLGVNFLLNYGGKISGQILDSGTMMPPVLPNGQTVWLQFYDVNETVVGGARMNFDGSYTSARALPPGNYAVRTGTMFNGVISSPLVDEKYDDVPCPGVSCDLSTEDVNVTAQTTTGNIDFSLAEGFSFSGTINEIGTTNGIADVHVLVYKDMGVGEDPKFATWTTTSDGTGTPIGSFTVSGLPEGTYYARTNNGSNLPFDGIRPAPADGWIDILYDSISCPGSCDVTMGTPIVLSSVRGNEPSFDFNLTQGASIAGNVSDETFGLGLDGVNVNVYNSSGELLASYTTDSSGNYLTSGFPAGTYYLTTSSFDVLVDVLYGNQICTQDTCNPLDGTPVVLAEQEEKTGIDFTLKTDYIYGQSFE